MPVSEFEFHASAILFDMDGTLVDSSVCVERQWSDWAARHGLNLAKVLEVSHGRPTIDTMRDVAPELATEREVARFDRNELADRDGIRAVDGAGEILRDLPANCWAVVTSASRALAESRLKHSGLPLPPVLVSSDDIVHGKPNPEGYLQAALRLGREPAECLVLEDAPVGIEAARAAGMAVLGVTTNYPASRLDGVPAIADFTSLAVLHSGKSLIVRKAM